MQDKKVLCLNWSKANKQCRFCYTENLMINPLDIIPQCDGFKTESQCCWFKGYQNIWKAFP